MPTFQPSANLRSRTFRGLLVAQFLAAFNDQAIHAASMFFAINQQALDEAQAISLMPILFYAPWALFCTVAGYFADRYSKRNALVFWKVAEIAITLIALLGFWLGTQGYHRAGPYLVLSTVFLMGTHSAFFVPAKYGAMPEILQPQMLSRGNGILESLSFLAVILGTVAGGILSCCYRGQEYLIGLILVALAVLGAAASLFIRRMPAANPNRPFPPLLYKPLWDNIRTLLRSRPLALSVAGIAFFTFLVAFMRATVYMHGQSQVPPWSESKTSAIVGMVAFGIGIGSPLVGFLSGGKVELGLVPVGALGMVVAAVVAALSLNVLPALIACIALIGFFAGFYIVPLYTLLQHRAPRASKGDSIATSNFINVTGAIIASLVFFLMDATAKHTGLAPEVPPTGREVRGVLQRAPEFEEGLAHRVVLRDRQGEEQTIARRHAEPYPVLLRVERGLKPGEEVVVREYRMDDGRGGHITSLRVRRASEPPRPVYNKKGMPRLLFLSAGLMTLCTLLLLWRLMPDLFLRTLLWLRTDFRYRLEIFGMSRLPSHGPAVVVTNAGGIDPCLRVLSATDRTTRFLLVQQGAGDGRGPFLRPAAARTNLAVLPAGAADHTDWPKLAAKAEEVLGAGGIVGLSLPGQDGEAGGRLLEALHAHAAPVLPVYYEAAPVPPEGRRRRIYIIAGPLLPPGTSAKAVRQELHRLAEEFRQKDWRGLEAERALSQAH